MNIDVVFFRHRPTLLWEITSQLLVGQLALPRHCCTSEESLRPLVFLDFDAELFIISSDRSSGYSTVARHSTSHRLPSLDFGCSPMPCVFSTAILRAHSDG